MASPDDLRGVKRLGWLLATCAAVGVGCGGKSASDPSHGTGGGGGVVSGGGNGGAGGSIASGAAGSSASGGGSTASGAGGSGASGGAGGAAGSSAGGGGGSIADDGGTSFEPQLGDWAGSTSQGEAITFTVVAGGISKFHVDYAGNGCVAGLADLSLDSTTPIATIANESFTDKTTRTSGSGPLGTYSFAGRFTSASSASGTFTFALTAIGSTDCGGSGSATWTAAPASDGGVACRLTNCGGTTSLTFTYSCGTASSTSESSYGVGVGTMLTVTYSNGHTVHCLNGPADGGTVQRCTDDTGAVCTWTNPTNPPPVDAGGSSMTPPCATDVTNGAACSTSGESCNPAVAVGPVPCRCTAQAGGKLLWTCPIPPPDASRPGP